jgi:hypothetical protein
MALNNNWSILLHIGTFSGFFKKPSSGNVKCSETEIMMYNTVKSWSKVEISSV